MLRKKEKDRVIKENKLHTLLFQNEKSEIRKRSNSNYILDRISHLRNSIFNLHLKHFLKTNFKLQVMFPT